MKIFHTGDWHIGKIVNQVHMTQDQEYVLQNLIEVMEAERPDALIITGDIYDRAVPPVEAVELLNKVLNKILLELQIPVLIISGNHDSPDRLDFGNQILQAKGLHIEGRFHKEVRKVIIEDGYGPVNFYLIPYASPALVKDVLGREDIDDYDSAMKVVVESIREKWDHKQRNVILSHGFVRGISEPELSESEKPLSLTSVGGADYVNVNHFQGFTYTALGHLHGPQSAGHEAVRYAGSLLKYSFSETTQKKGITVVDIDSNGNVQYSHRPLKTLRDMRKIKGQLQALLDPSVYKHTNVNDYLHVTLTDEGELLEAMAKLRQVYPNVLALEFEAKERSAGEDKTSAGEGYKQKTKLELFRDFYCDITGKEFTPAKESLVSKVIEDIDKEERGA